MKIKTHYYEFLIANIPVTIALSFCDTHQYMPALVRLSKEPRDAISVQENDYLQWERLGNQRSPQAEYSLLSLEVSDYLLMHERCLFHAVGLICSGNAWLIVGAPGVGKSTQYANLKQMYDEDIIIISGDRPALDFSSEQIVVHPSPWNGKERWAGDQSAVLKGIVLLEQGHENKLMENVPKLDTVLRLFTSIFQTNEKKDVMEAAARCVERLYQETKIYKLINKGDLRSSVMLYDIMKRDR